MARLVQLLRQPEFQLFAFCLFFMLVNWPFLAVSTTGGLLATYIYLFLLWTAVILLLFLIQRTVDRDDSGEDDVDEGGG